MNDNTKKANEEGKNTKQQEDKEKVETNKGGKEENEQGVGVGGYVISILLFFFFFLFLLFHLLFLLFPLFGSRNFVSFSHYYQLLVYYYTEASTYIETPGLTLLVQRLNPVVSLLHRCFCSALQFRLLAFEFLPLLEQIGGLCCSRIA